MKVSKKAEKRKATKKAQRKRRRQTAAQARELVEAEEEAARLRDPVYCEWLQQQKQLEIFQCEAGERERELAEEAWLRRELLAQVQFQKERKRQAADEAATLQRSQELERELEARKAEQRRRREETAAEFERLMQRIQEYLDEPPALAGSPPAELQRCVESRPGAKLCEFFERTNCCRFGAPCQFNHRRPLLSRCLMLRHCFHHPLLELTPQRRPDEYDSAEAALETSERELRADYDAFFDDVVPELECHGALRNVRAVLNVQPHLRGHVFVEYTAERDALQAFVKLQGRYYASKRLSVEFSHLREWRSAVCGLSLTRRCPKGTNCNYLHLFRNPGNKYNTPLENRRPTPRSQLKTETPSAATPTNLSWNDVDKPSVATESSHWRWTPSPEQQPAASKDDCIAAVAPAPAVRMKSPKMPKTQRSKRSRSRHKRHNGHKNRSRSRSRASSHDRRRRRSASRGRKSRSKKASRSRSHKRSSEKRKKRQHRSGS